MSTVQDLEHCPGCNPSSADWISNVSAHLEVRRLRNIVVPDSVRSGLCVENTGIPREQML